VLGAADVHEVRQVVVIGIRVVDKAALFDEQFPRVDARAVAAVPAARTLAAGFLDRLDAQPDVLGLLLTAERPGLLPPPAV
jgi:hypothetical protein